jgi:NodT family efflux transporter outer membrane factor (OMF) lipoprotein
MKRRCFIIVIGASLVACAGVRNDAPSDASVQAPSTWRVPTPTGTPPLQADWWKSFGDDTLSALVEEALSHSDDIALSAVRVQEARAQFRYTQAQRLPNVRATLQGGRNRSVNPGFGVPEYQNAGQGLVEASFDIDLFGRLKASSEAARSALLATQDAQYIVRLSVTASLVSGYFTLLALDARLAIVRETVDVRRNELRVEQRRFNAGYSNALDLTRAQAELAATEQLIPTLELSVARAENGLSILLGRVPGPIVRGGTFDQLSLPEVPVSLPSTLLRSRPDIVAAEARLAATDHALDAARAAFLPDIQLAVTGGFVGSNLVNSSPVRIWSIGGSVLAPLFDAGRLQAQQDAATAQRDEAAFAYRKTTLQAFREVEDDLTAVLKNQGQFDALNRERAVLARAFQLATRRYREGYASYLDQLDAQRNLLSSELSLVQSRLDRFNTAVGLIQALGGGWAP